MVSECFYVCVYEAVNQWSLGEGRGPTSHSGGWLKGSLIKLWVTDVMASTQTASRLWKSHRTESTVKQHGRHLPVCSAFCLICQKTSGFHTLAASVLFFHSSLCLWTIKSFLQSWSHTSMQTTIHFFAMWLNHLVALLLVLIKWLPKRRLLLCSLRPDLLRFIYF